MGNEQIKKFLPVIIAGLAGLVAVFLINTYVGQRVDEAKKINSSLQENMVTVVVAKQDIAAGAALKENMLKEEKISREIAQRGSANSIERVVDKISMAPIARGEQVLLNKVTLSNRDSSLSMKVPKGKRAITLTIDNISSVGGMIQPGDHVDIMGMVPIPVTGADGKASYQMTTMPLFQDVAILAVGSNFTSAGVKKEGDNPSAITFALTPHETNLITFIQEQQGKLRLVLRSPEDTQIQQAAPVDWSTILKTVMPQAFENQAQAVEQPVKKPGRRVEIIRGLQKETKELE